MNTMTNEERIWAKAMAVIEGSETWDKSILTQPRCRPPFNWKPVKLWPRKAQWRQVVSVRP